MRATDALGLAAGGASPGPGCHSQPLRCPPHIPRGGAQGPACGVSPPAPRRYEAELSPVEHRLSARRSPLAQRPFFEAPSALGSVDLYDYECEDDDDLQPS